MTCLTATAFAASAASVLPLWPEGVPNAKPRPGKELLADGRISNVSEPALTVIAPPPGKANGTAAIICPGGGYVRLSAEREGLHYAQWLASLGVTSYILKYRLAEFGHPAPLQDGWASKRPSKSGKMKHGC